MRYRIIYERSRLNFGAYSPDLPGCVTTGETLEETRRLMREAIDFHLEGLALDGDVRPKPSGYVEILDYEPVAPRKRRKASARVSGTARKPATTVARPRRSSGG